MAAKNWPWPINQPGQPYPAEILRAQHYAATSGGNGVSSPESFKVSAQTAPDGTIRVAPGGADIVSTYAGQSEQSYHASGFAPEVVEIPPTGSSSGGRHDLIVLRVCDPQFDEHPEAQRNETGEITKEEAAKYDFWWIEVVQGRSATVTLPYPHVRLAHIRRPANTTIVTNDHILDLRWLSNPKNHLHMRANNMITPDTQSLHSGSTIWPRDATHTMRIPEFATRVHIWGTWALVRAVASSQSTGIVTVALVHPDGSRIITQQSRWRNTRTDGASYETLNIMVGDNRPVPAKFRGEEVTVEMRGTKTQGPNVFMDGNSSWSVQLYFEQEIT